MIAGRVVISFAIEAGSRICSKAGVPPLRQVRRSLTAVKISPVWASTI